MQDTGELIFEVLLLFFVVSKYLGFRMVTRVSHAGVVLEVVSSSSPINKLEITFGISCKTFSVVFSDLKQSFLV